MLHRKFSRHTRSFGLITGASIALYPAAQAKNDIFIWLLLIIIFTAAILTLFETS